VKILKTFNAISLALVFILLFSTAAFAQTDKGEIELTPSKDSYVKLDSVKLIILDSNNYQVKLTRNKKAGSEPLHFIVQIDPEKKTYKTVKSEPLPIKYPDFKKSDSGSSSLSTTNTDYSVGIYITTTDIPGAPCCQTGLWLNWTVNKSNIINANYHKDQYDWQPTLFNTNWYLSYHNLNYFNWGSNRASVSSSAKHYNYDWRDPNLATYAYHDITINGYPSGQYGYTTNWYHSGEDKNLLTARVDEY
jgi:hypothetical protein